MVVLFIKYILIGVLQGWACFLNRSCRSVPFRSIRFYKRMVVPPETKRRMNDAQAQFTLVLNIFHPLYPSPFTPQELSEEGCVRKVQEQFGIELKTEQDTFVLFEVQLINLNSVVSLYYHYRVDAHQFFHTKARKARTDFNEFELRH